MEKALELLDFQEAKVQTLSLNQLKRTHKENDIMGHPLKGIYHYELLEQTADIITSAGLKMQIEEIFAAQNKDRNQPGVVILPQVEEQFGYRAVEAHVLRRVFANISIKDLDDEEFSTNLAVAFHQNGIQIGFGNMVKVCHNQCIMRADNIISNFGEDKKSIEQIFEHIKGWMDNINNIIIPEREKLTKMKSIVIPPDRLLQFIGNLTTIRVAHDTSIKEIRQNGTYPLSQTQISQLTESLLVTQQEKQEITLWDFYNAATELYKADRMEIPNILPQHVAMFEFIQNQM